MSRLNNESKPCSCHDETIFKGNQVKEKVSKNLIQIAYGHQFGDVLYRCKDCGQFWEENLSEATYHDWPPILKKMSVEEVKKKYGI